MKNKDREYLQHCFLRMLLEGNYSLNESELNKWGMDLSLSLQEESWLCIVVRNIETAFNGSSQLQLKHHCEKAMSELGICGYSVIGYNMDVILLLRNLGNAHRNLLEKLSSVISQRNENLVQMGVGYEYKELSYIHRSKEEAYEALAWGGPQILISDIREICKGESVPIATLQSNRKKILEQFRKGELQGLQQNLETLAEEVRASTVIQVDAPYPTSIRRTMIELLVEMMHIASDAGVDVDAKIGFEDPYKKIFELQGTPLIIRWVVEVAETICNEMYSRKERMETSVLKQVQSYIQEHISDIDLSLSSASYFVGMSPSYLSAFFIRESGMGFKEYVTARRIELAKTCLVESSDSINVISEQCGFLSPSYFISVFKNQTGKTPGVYRKMKN